ncbi:MAG: discoidin domain-containing protein [Hominisplanchenecus sp.]
MDTATKLGTQYRLATLNIPIKYIGSTTGNSFNGLIDEIELTNDQDDSIIPTTDFSFTYDNEQNPAQGSDGPISNAFDGDITTLWHSQYSPSIKALPATFTVDMGKEYKINKLTYVPRQSGGANGYITSYDLYVKKAESDDWTQVVTDGVWASDTKEKTAKFNTVDARYIKFVAKEGSNGFATASEFHIHQVLNEEEQEVTKAQEALNEAVNDSSIKGIYEAGNADGTYTSASWTAFKEAYEAAKAPSEGASAEELKTLLTNLQSAKAGLKNAAVESAKETLKAEVDKAENKNIYEAGNADGTYTKDSWTAFKEAYEAAKAPSEGASAEELKTLLTNLQNAKAGLKKSQTETPPTPNQTETPATPGQTEKPSTPEKPTVVQKVSKNVTYRVLDTKKKTAAVVGVGGKKGKKVTSVTIAKTVKINGVTYKVTKIGKNAFKGCKYLKKITIGSNVKKIEKGAFANCRKLASINMKKANGITSIGSKSFSKINSKAKVSVPSKKLSKYTRMLKKAGLPKKAVIKK